MARKKKETFLDLLDRMTPTVKAAFLQSVQEIKDAATIAAIVEAIKQGNATAAVEAVGLTSAAFRPLSAAIERAFETGGIFTADQIRRPVGKAVFRFDVRNSRAEAWLREFSSDLVTRINAEQLEQIRNVIEAGMRAGINPRSIALDIVGRIDPLTGKRTGGIIGLNGPQTKWLTNAREELQNMHLGDPGNYFARELRDKRFDATVKKALDTGKPLTSDEVTKLTTQYENNLLRYRGETIARDQTLTALNKSQDEAIKQIVDTGNYEERDISRVWDSTGNDGRTRETHLEMEGQTVAVNEPFVTPDGYRMMFPGDNSLGAPPAETINCRCVVKLKIDYIGAAKRKTGR